MSDFKVNAEGDLDLTNAALSLVTGDEAIAQHMTTRYKGFLGESVYNTSAGCPWIQAILGQPAMVESAEFILTDYGERTPGIQPGSVKLTLEFNDATRGLTVTGTAQANNTLIPISLDVGVA